MMRMFSMITAMVVACTLIAGHQTGRVAVLGIVLIAFNLFFVFWTPKPCDT